MHSVCTDTQVFHRSHHSVVGANKEGGSADQFCPFYFSRVEDNGKMSKASFSVGRKGTIWEWFGECL